MFENLVSIRMDKYDPVTSTVTVSVEHASGKSGSEACVLTAAESVDAAAIKAAVIKVAGRIYDRLDKTITPPVITVTKADMIAAFTK